MFYAFVEHVSSSPCQTQSLLINLVQLPTAPTYRQESGAQACAHAVMTCLSVSISHY